MVAQRARFGLEKADLERVGVKRGVIERWEDGMRTDGAAGNYEWWYSDAHFDDGSSAVITFYTKSMMASNLPLSPQITVNFLGVDGTTIRKVLHFEPGEFEASKEKTDVSIGKNHFRGDLDQYDIHVEFEDVVLDLHLTRTTPSWRLGNGYSYYGDQDEKHMAWFSAVPAATATLALAVGDKTRTFEGRGYHDHNWGNVPELQILHHWYWGRAYVGPFAVISYDMTAAEPYGYQHLPMFMLTKDGIVVAEDPGEVKVSLEYRAVDPHTDKPVYGTITYTYGDRYRVRYEREQTIEALRMIDALQDPALRKAVEANGFNGGYLRFTGTVTIEELSAGSVVSSYSGKGIWELMYFGNPID